jgi:hypothetical protein
LSFFEENTSTAKNDTLQTRDPMKNSTPVKNVARFQTRQTNTIIKNQKVEAEASKFRLK